MIYGTTETGYNPNSFQNILDEMQISAKGLFGEEWRMDIYSAEGMMMYIMADLLNKLWEADHENYKAKFIDNCYGVLLDNQGSNVALPRDPGKFATSTVEFTTDIPTIISKGTLVRIRDTDLLFETTVNLEIDSSLVGSVQVVATQRGKAYNAIIGSITELVTSNINIMSLTNTVEATGGADTETDVNYRERIRNANKAIYGSSTDGITSQLINIADINKIKVYENPDDVVNSDGIAPGKIRVYVDGVISQELADTLAVSKSACHETEGTTEVETVNMAGQTKIMRFYTFTNKGYWVKVDITDIQGNPDLAYIKNNIVNSINEYLTKVKEMTDNTIYFNKISAICFNSSDAIINCTVQISIDGVLYNTNDVLINISELYFTDSDKVTVEVV